MLRRIFSEKPQQCTASQLYAGVATVRIRMLSFLERVLTYVSSAAAAQETTRVTVTSTASASHVSSGMAPLASATDRAGTHRTQSLRRPPSPGVPVRS